MELGDHATGLRILLEVVETRRRLVADHPTLFDDDLASALHNLAKMAFGLGQVRVARDHVEEAVALYRVLAGRLPAVHLVNLANALGTKGFILLQGFGEARAAAEALAEAERIGAEIGDEPLRASASAGLEIAPPPLAGGAATGTA